MEGVDPEESRLREAAELKWRTAALHRIRAARPTRSGEPGGEFQVRVERGPAKVAAEHAMAFQELANVVEARCSAAHFAGVDCGDEPVVRRTSARGGTSPPGRCRARARRVTVVFAAALAMIAFVLIPAGFRYWRLAAVLGWNPVDLTGLGVAVGSQMAFVVRQHRHRPDEDG